ncbi:hypothetical protein RFI_03934 [Reticulomyxa filosa]|uniref:Uncharacterized protein n=1 Tax=Reticulomyxa filosa TaxID=46433 RepID=X6P4X4_RETFI|nr:hypothetical protein RFI_03934 [Reticulomyxa filosa]|eukprot:ETO33173.1 hypothetical protein RFI_03934 [Reticulomyxa filosa]
MGILIIAFNFGKDQYHTYFFLSIKYFNFFKLKRCSKFAIFKKRQNQSLLQQSQFLYLFILNQIANAIDFIMERKLYAITTKEIWCAVDEELFLPFFYSFATSLSSVQRRWSKNCRFQCIFRFDEGYQTTFSFFLCFLKYQKFGAKKTQHKKKKTSKIVRIETMGSCVISVVGSSVVLVMCSSINLIADGYRDAWWWIPVLIWMELSQPSAHCSAYHICDV